MSASMLLLFGDIKADTSVGCIITGDGTDLGIKLVMAPSIIMEDLLS